MPQDDPKFTGGAGRRAIGHMGERWRTSVTRRLSERGDVPDSFAFKPASMTLGSAELAAAKLRGQFTLNGTTIRIERGDPWRTDPPSTGWAEALHGFQWMADFRASDGDAARKAARRVTDAWLHRHGKAGGLPWRPAITGDRVVAWCMSADLLTENAEPVYRSDFFRSLATQARYLDRTAAGEALPVERLRASLGVAYAGLCLPGYDEMRERGVALVVKAATAATLSDGGPSSRNPSDLLTLLHGLVQLREDIEKAGEGVLSAKLTPLIEKSTPILRMLRAGDGGLALFNGARADDAARINLVLVESGDTKPAPEQATASGYLRLNAGTTNALIDAGAAAEGVYARSSHAAPLALNVSSNGQRMIVNCGSAVHLATDWHSPCRASAAHSALTVAERSPCDFEGKPNAPFRKIIRCARILEQRCERDDTGIWALAAHDGYTARYGLIHYRRLFLDSSGADFRGEDTLTLAKGGARTLEKSRAARKSPDGPHFAIRFHLHPDVRVSIADNKALIALRNGEQWQMMQSGGKIGIEDSVYIPGLSAPVPCKQIVIESALRDTEGQVRWALKRLATANSNHES